MSELTVDATELRRQFVAEIRSITDLIDELRLVDTLVILRKNARRLLVKSTIFRRRSVFSEVFATIRLFFASYGYREPLTRIQKCGIISITRGHVPEKGSGRILMKRTGRLLAVYACGHFLVDLSCAFLLLSLSPSGGDRLPVILLYNLCAFALQMPLGLLADRLDRNGAVASAGLVLTSAACLCRSFPLLCAVVLGLGNALYHVGGGVDVLTFSDRKGWMLGVFVSPGAIGLFLGTLLSAHRILPLPMLSLILGVLSAAVIVGLHLARPLGGPSGNADFSIRPTGRAPALAAFCLFLVVILRSYVGVTLHTPWKNGLLLSLLAVLGLAFGKAAGGFLADRFGEMRTAVVSLAICSVLFLFSENAVCGIAAIFLFNMTMPLTLFAMARLFPGARGFAFGALTFALFLGCVPTFLSLPTPFSEQVWFHALEAAVSLILLTVGLTACRERGTARE